jgi:polysaccharide deacetylase family protein (PEP-CTERM system associated)
MNERQTIPIVNAMTVDVEEYFHATAVQEVVSPSRWESLESRVERGTESVLRLFAEFGVRATFFVLGWSADRHKDLVKRIAAAGHEVASHGYAHRLVYDQSREEFREDITRAKHLLEDITGQAADGYRAPTFSITSRSLWAMDVIADVGHRYDASIFPTHHDRYGIPDAPRGVHERFVAGGSLLEWPGSTMRVLGMNVPFAGGGYFRLLPYSAIRWALRRLHATEHCPAIFYIHPWELDPGQPRQPLPRLSAARHYVNIGRTEARLRRLLGEFRFAPVRDLLWASSR